MYDPKETVENQTENAPHYGDAREEVHEEEPTREQVLEEAFDEIQDSDLRKEAGYDKVESVDDHGRGPYQPVYGDSYEEEFAQEAAIGPIDEPMNNGEQETTMEEDVQVGMAWLGLSAAILSFFFAPLILGAAGIILGIVGKRRGADTLGNMAIIISVVSIAFSLFFAPFINFL
ncbi:hypothetical protein GLW04_07835 [Halobacillus litoralis]|uniref:DUF4190 domain-containing protein n=1 Tax=Halobacillus litoralis TaxID=45668 RepID=A0A845DTW3_9BACI|nr:MULTISPECIES: DUF4190 domain-containing protein [Halobacillus]MYL19792.1 hypothetical protein [Halobacillus litoralis]MYL28938.1 hypothetical protein [Halobacillus halophilus]MYL37189.1 hypothetical protein [Halobacillus litoralis]